MKSSCKNSTAKSVILIIALLWFCVVRLAGWGINTHKRLSYFSVFKSNLDSSRAWIMLSLEKGPERESLESLGYVKNPLEWVGFGAQAEDESPTAIPTRSNNHFHNPQKSDIMESALSDIHIGSAMSLVHWMQSAEQKDYIEGDNSWESLRFNYFNTLIAQKDEIKRANWALIFKGLGHQIHLIQDAAVPDHVRNDSHVLNNYMILNKKNSQFRCIEGWLDNNLNIIDLYATQPLFPDIDLRTSAENDLFDPIFRLVDTNLTGGNWPSGSLQQGLAEYCSSNFISEDTVLTDNLSSNDIHYLPFPRRAGTNLDVVMNGSQSMPVQFEDGNQYNSKYISKFEGDPVNHFLYMGYYGNYLSPPELAIFSDEICFKDYASMLVPRAVGYSATLLNYFFRGKIDIALPGTTGGDRTNRDGVYAFATKDETGFKKITVLARNATPNNEEMGTGQIYLVVRFRLSTGNGDPFSENPPPPEEYQNFISIAHPYVTKLPSDRWERLEFDLGSKPIPFDAVDVTLSLVFYGPLGGEKHGVALGFKDISEPTPIDFFNDSDRVCFQGEFKNWDEPVVVKEADKNNNGVIDCSLDEASIVPNKIKLIAILFNGNPVSSTDYYYKFPEEAPVEILPGKSYRIFTLTDAEGGSFASSVLVHAKKMDGTTPSHDNQCLPAYAVTVSNSSFHVNKLDWMGEGYIHRYSPMKRFRDIIIQNLYMFSGGRIPEDSICKDSMLRLYRQGASADPAWGDVSVYLFTPQTVGNGNRGD